MGFFSNQNPQEKAINSQIQQTHNQINELYTDLGRYVKLNLKDKIDDQYVKNACQNIDDCLQRLQQLNKDLIGARGNKLCVNCSAEIPMAVSFCPQCGTQQPPVNNGMGMNNGMPMNNNMGMNNGMPMNNNMGMNNGMPMNNQGFGAAPAAPAAAAAAPAAAAGFAAHQPSTFNPGSSGNSPSNPNRNRAPGMNNNNNSSFQPPQAPSVPETNNIPPVPPVPPTPSAPQAKDTDPMQTTTVTNDEQTVSAAPIIEDKAPAAPAAPASEGFIFCSQCGHKEASGVAFCSQCGSKL